ncbi:hypothetical protein Tsubulata_023441 [Turnera subulata]|uniref:Binding protein n=1 Tax=Turnera subulata TaxID=218843 RepID=A0A9Q0G706_9ROSI|nr:hypothetical protein Tsubulata_023441 [Turnera subulata]
MLRPFLAREKKNELADDQKHFPVVSASQTHRSHLLLPNTVAAVTRRPKMLRQSLKNPALNRATSRLLQFYNPRREMHSRNKKAMELIAKGWSALKEVDRVIDYTQPNDQRLIPLLRGAKENFELALEVDNSNTQARYWLSRLHFKYHVPGACKAVGAALLVEAAEMGNPDAQYELGCRLRVENDYVQSDQQAFYYLEKAVEQLHPGALYLLGTVYLTGDCVKKDLASAMWCFHRASEKGHAGAAVAYGSLLLRGAQVPESIIKFNLKRGRAGRKVNNAESTTTNPVEMAKEQFQVAAKAGCNLGLIWLQRIEEAEKRLVAENSSSDAIPEFKLA